ncbi:MAG: symmetrical bis(5'-nucleosyl)-tetraphosphatase [Sedimenticolaceae bacterium]
MAVYAIGDIQGCYDELRQALDAVDFDSATDRLWCVGDLVNRGPKSLDVLRFVRSLGNTAICVLGNHDLHLLALAAGNPKHRSETGLTSVLTAPDRDELLHWLRHRPLLHFDRAIDFLMVHAGLPPQWDLTTAISCAHELEQVLRSSDADEFFLQMYGNKPDRWKPELSGIARWRFITNCLTRLRYCDAGGRLALREKGPPGSQAKGRIPWFDLPQRATREQRIVFGHWSTLGYLARHNVWALDTGCLWGGALTLLRLDQTPPAPHSVPCAGWQDPTSFT